MLHDGLIMIGQKLFQLGLNNSHSGNLSVRRASSIYISRTGSMLDQLTSKDIICVGMIPNPKRDQAASMELIVHRSLYLADNDICAVVHAHSPYSVVMAEGKDVVIPYDAEGQYFLSSIPVISVANCIASQQVANSIINYVADVHAIIVERHGVYSWGKNLEEAYHYLSVVESACRINYLRENRHVAS